MDYLKRGKEVAMTILTAQKMGTEAILGKVAQELDVSEEDALKLYVQERRSPQIGADAPNDKYTQGKSRVWFWGCDRV